MNPDRFKRARFACYSSYFSMSSIFCVPSMLFVTFHETYGISYTLLGTLVLFNFCTQLCIDLVFTFFAKYFNVKKTVTVMPLITSFGIMLYALLPTLFPQHAFIGLAAGTVFFSISAGLSEVLLSPIVSAIPSDNPEHDMSLLHSLYAWGVASMVVLASLFLNIFGTEHWQILIFILALFPIVSSVLFGTSELPDVILERPATDGKNSGRKMGLALCVVCIFLGAAAENTMTNWISGFMEAGLGVPKAYCDLVGIALFAALLGLARSLFAKYGKNISNVLIISFAGAIVCYLTAGVCTNSTVAAIASVACGFFTSMLWPGTLIMMEENMPAMGVAAYALVAAGGDMGSSVAPQLMGIITDAVEKTDFAATLASKLSLTTEQVGLKTGMVISALFPIIGLALMFYIRNYFRKMKQ